MNSSMTIRAFFGLVSLLLALLHWPDFGGTTANSLDSNTSNEILPKKKALTVKHEILL